MRTDATQNSALKKSILREIYVDYLKFSGKHIAEVNALPKTKRTVYLLYVILIGCAVAMSSFTPWAPLRQTQEVTQESRLALSQTDSQNTTSNAGLDTAPGVNPPTLESALSAQQPPFWDWYQPADQQLDDFDLLLSSNGSIRLSALFGLKVKTIVIDPGHGGKDPGAIGKNGTQEKDITLDVAIKLKKRLNALRGVHVLLTRETDRTLSLAERVDFAKANAADRYR